MVRQLTIKRPFQLGACGPLRLPLMGRRVTLSAQTYLMPEWIRREKLSTTGQVRRRGALFRVPPGVLAEYATLRDRASQAAAVGTVEATMVSVVINAKAATKTDASVRVSPSSA